MASCWTPWWLNTAQKAPPKNTHHGLADALDPLQTNTAEKALVHLDVKTPTAAEAATAVHANPDDNRDWWQDLLEEFGEDDHSPYSRQARHLHGRQAVQVVPGQELVRLAGILT